MKRSRLLFLLPFLLLVAIAATAAPPAPASVPFTLTLVPSRRQAPPLGTDITIADDKADVFHVVLANVSAETLAAFETWNSWGYQAVSFEITMPDGKKTVVSKSDQNFTVNAPSIFLIPSGEPQVFPIKLDKTWEMNPKVTLASETEVTIKAIYEVTETPASKEHRVWTGRVESKPCKLTLRHR